MHQPLENYLEQVKSQLKSLPPDKQDEEVQEIRNHLLAIIESQSQSGDSEEAIATALRQFGPPRQVGRSLRKAWHSRSAQQKRRTTPINKFVSAAIWGLAFNTLAGVVGGSIYGAYAGVWVGLQLKQGITPSGHFPGMATWLAAVTYGPQVIGLVGLLLALSNRLPTFHIERKLR